MPQEPFYNSPVSKAVGLILSWVRDYAWDIIYGVFATSIGAFIGELSAYQLELKAIYNFLNSLNGLWGILSIITGLPVIVREVCRYFNKCSE